MDENVRSLTKLKAIRAILEYINSRKGADIPITSRTLGISKDFLVAFCLHLSEQKLLTRAADSSFNITERFLDYFRTGSDEVLAKRCAEEFTPEYEPSEIFIDADWGNIEVEAFLIYPGKEDYYEIGLYGKTISLSEADVLTAGKFRQNFFKLFGKMLPPIPGKYWAQLITTWRQEHGETVYEKREDYSEGQEAVDVIVDYVESCRPVQRLEDTFSFHMAYVNGVEIRIPSEVIKKVLSQHDLRVSPRRLSFLIKDYLASGTRVIKVKDKAKRFWIFDKRQFTLNNKETLSFEEKEGSGTGEGDMSGKKDADLRRTWNGEDGVQPEEN